MPKGRRHDALSVLDEIDEGEGAGGRGKGGVGWWLGDHGIGCKRRASLACLLKIPATAR